MNHPEMNSDEMIDRVLTGLREAEPLEGMQQRVLHAARERAGIRRRWSLRLPLASMPFWSVAAVTVAMIALTASWTIVRSHRTAYKVAHAPAHPSPEQTPAAETHVASATIARPRPLHEPRRPSTEEEAAFVGPVSDEDALAISEMLAPSKPAPPLPLTHQEKLLAEVVHQGAPEELDSLRPDVRAREIEIAKAEFHDFFEPPSLDQPPAKVNE